MRTAGPRVMFLKVCRRPARLSLPSIVAKDQQDHSVLVELLTLFCQLRVVVVLLFAALVAGVSTSVVECTGRKLLMTHGMPNRSNGAKPESNPHKNLLC